MQAPRDDDAAAVGRANGCAGRTQEIAAAMRTSFVAVEDAARAEPAVGGARHRPGEGAVPQAFGRGRPPYRRELRGVAIDAREPAPGGGDERLAHSEPARREVPRAALRSVRQ